ncbi:MAG: ATP-binding protein, partial [Bacteroidota bacterium]
IEILLDCSSDAVYILDPETFNIIDANQNASLLLGNFNDALSEYCFLEFIEPDFRESWTSHIQSVYNSERENFSGRLKTFFNNNIIVEAKTRLSEQNGKLVLVSLIKEVTGFPHQINQLKKQIDFYETILNEMPTQFAVLSPKWRYMFINKPSIRDDEFRNWMIGKSDYDFCEYRNKNTELARVRQENYQAVADSREVKEWVEEIKTKDGETNYILRKLYPYFVENKLYLSFGFGIDVTKIIKAEKERKIMMESMAQKNEELRQFAYIVTHDLKEPLRGISSFSNLLAKRYSEKLEGEAFEFLNYITSSVARMNSLLTDLTSFVTIGRDQTETKQINLEDTVLLAQANLKMLIEESEAEIITRNLPVFPGYKVYMNQLIQNLINNALKFRREKPVIEISSIEEKDHYVVEVKDNGIGIKEEYKSKIFQLFSRLNKVDYEGTGMGLAICKKIVQMHGGEIWVESDGATGTSFFFSLRKGE